MIEEILEKYLSCRPAIAGDIITETDERTRRALLKEIVRDVIEFTLVETNVKTKHKSTGLEQFRDALDKLKESHENFEITQNVNIDGERIIEGKIRLAPDFKIESNNDAD